MSLNKIIGEPEVITKKWDEASLDGRNRWHITRIFKMTCYWVPRTDGQKADCTKVEIVDTIERFERKNSKCQWISVQTNKYSKTYFNGNNPPNNSFWSTF